MGPHLRYFLLDRQGRPLGCLLFSQATHSLACRDAWVGWPAGAYKKHLDLVVKWLRNGGQLRLRQMRQRSNCVRWCRIHHRQGGQ